MKGAGATSASYVVWPVFAGGQVGEVAYYNADGVRELVQHAQTTGGLVLVLATPMPEDTAAFRRRFVQLLPATVTTRSPPQVRPLTGPYVAPKDEWKAKLGAEGYVAGDLHADEVAPRPLVLAAWPAPPGELRYFIRAIEERKGDWLMVTPAHLRTLLERLIAVSHNNGQPVGRDRVLGYAAALRHCEQVVDDYELAFRSGQDFTAEQHVRIEQMLQELIMRREAFPQESMKTERLGLESRLVRLLDAQASRDAGGTLQRVLAALTALVLVPTLIAGVFGANVPIPFHQDDAMRYSMFALMATGCVLSYLLLGGLRQRTSTRELEPYLPGDPRATGPDGAWRARVAFAGLCGAAAGTVAEALRRLLDSDTPGIGASTTTWVVALAAVALAFVLLWIGVQEFHERSAAHLAVSATVAGGAAASASGILASDVAYAVFGGGSVLLAGSFAFVAALRSTLPELRLRRRRES